MTTISARRWKSGSSERLAARKHAKENGLCTTCLGIGHWINAKPATRDEPKTFVRHDCHTCGGSGKAPLA